MGPKESSPLKAFSALTLHLPVQIVPGPDPEGNEEESQGESETGSNPDDNEEADMGGPRFDYSA